MVGLVTFVALMVQGGVFPHTSANGWALDGLRVAIREGLLPERQGTLTGYRSTIDLTTSRYEVAVLIQAALGSQVDLAQVAAGRAEAMGVVRVLRAEALLPFYQRATREFAPEYKALNVDLSARLDRLVSLTRQIEANALAKSRLFRDVPVDHWAAKAVGDLRALGLLDGYPDGRYGG